MGKAAAAAVGKWTTIPEDSVAERLTSPRWSTKADSVGDCRTWSL